MKTAEERCSKKRKVGDTFQAPSPSTPSRANDLQDQVKAITNDLLRQLDVENDETLAACGTAPLCIIGTHPQAVLDLAHEKMHTFPYHAVPIHWRRLYEDASCYSAISILQSKPYSA
jgi:lysine-specific demethylase 8